MHTFQVDHRRRAWSAAVALSLGLAAPAAAQSRLVLPAGSVILVRTSAPLQSTSAQTGQTFETTVDQSVGMDEYTIIPQGSRIRGQITVARPATRQQSGVIEVVFDRILLAAPKSEDVTPHQAEQQQLQLMVGKKGRTLSMLNPGGLVSVDGRRLHAFSEGVMVDPNEWVEVLEVRGARVLVRRTSAPVLPPLDVVGPSGAGSTDVASGEQLDFDLPQS